MSAFLCSDAHFDALGEYAESHDVGVYVAEDSPLRAIITQYITADRQMAYLQPARPYRLKARDLGAALVARILRDENIRSIHARYPDTTDNNDMGTQDRYTFRRSHGKPAPVILGAVRCLDYQSCETSEWRETLACAILDEIKNECCRELSDGWELSEEDVHEPGVTVVCLTDLIGRA